MAQVPITDLIEFLLVRRFGVAAKFTGLPTIRSIDKRATTDPNFAHRVAAYKEQLQKLPLEELQALVGTEREKQKAEIAAKADREERERFFHQSHSVADFDHWSKAAHWTLDEAIALSFGKAPERVTWKNIESYVQVSPFALQYQRRRDLAIRAKAWEQLFDPVLPGIFLAWAKRNDIAVPPELESAVVARGVQIRDWKTLYDDLKVSFEANHKRWKDVCTQKNELIQGLRDEVQDLQTRLASEATALQTQAASEKTLGTRERESLLKLIIGMAIGGYGYDPTASRSEQPSAIASDLVTNGVSLDVDTVRKWLKEAAELLPKKAE